MPQIKCHNCGRVRLVLTGKRKNCRGCGAKLTDQQQPMSKNMEGDKAEKQTPEISVTELTKIYPIQVAEIVTAIKADAAAEEFGDLDADELKKAFPEAVINIVDDAMAEFKDLKPDELKKVFPDAVKELVAAAKAEGQKSILKLSAAKFEKRKKAGKAKTKK